MQSRLSWLPLAAVIATALAFMFPPWQPAKIFPDSHSYLNFALSAEARGSATFAFGRPPVGFLYWSLLGTSGYAVYVQTVLSIVCWSVLGWVTLGTAGAVFAAALAGSLWVAMWNYTVLSEPPTLSFGAATVAATLVLGRRWSWPRFALWCVCAFIFAGTRLENPFLVFPLFAALLLWHRAHWLPLGMAGLALAAMFVVFGILLDKQNTNWQYRMTNLVLTRFFNDQELAEWFFARGLPREESLFKWKGQLLAASDPRFAPDTPEFQRWLEQDSRAVYLDYLTGVDPHRKVLQSMDVLTSRGNGHHYYLVGIALAGREDQLVPFFDAVRLPFRYWRWLAVIPVVCVVLSRRVRFADVFALAYLVGVYVTTFIVYHADTGEMERHMSLIYMLYRMAPLVALAGALERILAWGRRRWPEPAHTDPTVAA